MVLGKRAKKITTTLSVMEKRDLSNLTEEAPRHESEPNAVVIIAHMVSCPLADSHAQRMRCDGIVL